MNLLILEDNTKDMERLIRQIEAWKKETGHEVYIQKETAIQKDSYAMRGLLDIDAAMLDVETPGIDGMSFAKHLRKYNSRIDIAFISNRSECLLASQDVYACSIIVKPTNMKKIFDLLDFWWERSSYAKGRAILTLQRGAYAVDKYYTDDILYAQALSHAVEIVTCSGRQRYNTTLQSIMKRLPQGEFCRCQRSIVVNVRKIKGLQDKKAKEIQLTNGETLRVGPKYIDDVRAVLVALV